MGAGPLRKGRPSFVQAPINLLLSCDRRLTGDAVLDAPSFWLGAGRERLRRRLPPVLICLLLAGCLAAPEIIPADAAHPVTTLDGIAPWAARQPGASLRVFFIHGMGTGKDEFCALAPLMRRLARALHVHQPPDQDRQYGACGDLVVSKLQGIPAPPPTPYSARLYTYSFVGNHDSRSVQFTFLLWAPLTKPIETERLDETPVGWNPSRALLTSAAKSFMQTHLADVVLYGGTYREVMRPVVEQALCYFVGGSIPDVSKPQTCKGGIADEETVLITHSLGGYILMDAFADLRAAHPSVRPSSLRSAALGTDAAAKVLARADLLFMLANQLALLDLTTLTQYPPPPAPPTSAATTKKLESRGILNAVLQYWPSQRNNSFPLHQIVAISDPNDILSYKVSSRDIPGPLAEKNVVVANVYLGVARNWFDLLAWPPAAHLNYLTNNDVMDIITCGMNGNAIIRCNP